MNMAKKKTPFGHKGFEERVKKAPPAFMYGENCVKLPHCRDMALAALQAWKKSPPHQK
jgi:hypothetical protein